MFNDLQERLYRVTVPGTATVNGKPEHFPLGRVLDSDRYDVAALDRQGVETAPVAPVRQ